MFTSNVSTPTKGLHDGEKKKRLGDIFFDIDEYPTSQKVQKTCPWRHFCDGGCIPGNVPTPTKAISDMVKAALPGIFSSIDEYHTSQKCPDSSYRCSSSPNRQRLHPDGISQMVMAALGKIFHFVDEYHTSQKCLRASGGRQALHEEGPRDCAAHRQRSHPDQVNFSDGQGEVG